MVIWLLLSGDPSYANMHSGHGEPYNSCAYGQLEPRQWISAGSKAHKELEIIVTNKLLCRDIKRLAHSGQTSALESYHKIVTFYAPKSVHFFYESMEARLLLAALRFNENCSRAQAVTKAGKPQWSISFPKARKEAPVVKPVQVPVTFGFVGKLFDEMMQLRDTFPSYARAKLANSQHT